MIQSRLMLMKEMINMMNYFGMMKIIKRSRIDGQIITEQRDYWETEWDPWGKAFKFLALCYTSTNKEKSGRRDHNRENKNKCCSPQASENMMQPTREQRWTKVEFDLKNHLNWKSLSLLMAKWCKHSTLSLSFIWRDVFKPQIRPDTLFIPNR